MPVHMFTWQSFLLLWMLISCVQSKQTAPCPALNFPYGRVSYQNQDKSASFVCNVGFQMVGKPSIRCVEGSWDSLPPICFSNQPGCPEIRRIDNGTVVVLQQGGIATTHCNAGYERLGSSVIFCNGTKWNVTVIPTCKERSWRVHGSREAVSPDSFSTEGIACNFNGSTCGWIQETSALYKWTLNNGRRPDGNPDVGPVKDAISDSAGNNGMYMFARPSSSGGNPTDTARMLSPVLNATITGNWCLKFWYHLHGIRHRAITVLTSKFKTGNAPRTIAQLFGDYGDRWNYAEISIQNETSRFRVIFEIKRGEPFSADAALDEISITRGACALPNSSDTWTVEPSQGRDNKTEDRNIAGLSLNGSSNPDIDNPIKEVNIDIYEVGNRSFVDEPSEFTIQVIRPHSTINPRNFGYLGYLNANNTAEAPDNLSDGEVVRDAQRRMYIGVGVGLAVLVIVIAGLVMFVVWSKRRVKLAAAIKTTTEETEFQYFSYNNDGFKEAATMSADRKSVRK